MTRNLRCKALGAFVAVSACDAPSPEPAFQGSAERGWFLSSEPVLSIGAGDAPAEYLFEYVVDVRLLPEGEIVVADWAPSVRVFDLNGRFHRRLGSVGQGPGEFQALAGIWLTPPDTLHVYDQAQLRIATYLLDGTPLKTVRLERTGHPDHVVGGFRDGTFVLGWLDYGAEADPLVRDRVSLGRWEGDGPYLGLHSQHRGASRFRREATNRPGMAFVSHPLAAYPEYTIWNDTLVFADPLGEVAFLTGENEVARTITVPIPDGDVDEALGQLHRLLSAERGALLAEGVPEVGELPRLNGLRVDSDGMIWVRQYDPLRDSPWLESLRRGGGRWLVVRPGGEMVASVTMPEGFVPHDVGGDIVVGVAIDDLDVQTVVAYSLIRGS